jgi:hypothetical protein
MSAITADSPARITSVQDRGVADHADRGHGPKRTWIWNLVEALAYAGAAFDPAAALAARRLARIRDQELHHRTGVS